MAVAVQAETSVTATPSATAPPAATSSPLTYAALAQMPLKDRLLAYPWKLEKISIATALVYLAFFYLGCRYNKRIVTRVIDSVKPILKDNFFQVGVTPNQLLAQDDQQHYTLYATGRLRIESMTAKFILKARQSPMLWLMQYAMGFFVDSLPAPEDELKITFQLDDEAGAKFDNFIWAIVTKDHMNDYRNEQYFLSLTKTIDSTDLPTEYVFMNEVSEMTKVLYIKKLASMVKKCRSFLKFLAITDQPSDRPNKLSELKPSKKLMLELEIPKTDKDLAALSDLLAFLLNEYIDYICKKAVFRPELTKKCKKTRETEYNKLKKAIDNNRREELNNKKAEQEKDKRSKLTPEEQQKLMKKQSQRRQRRAMNRQKVRM